LRRSARRSASSFRRADGGHRGPSLCLLATCRHTWVPRGSEMRRDLAGAGLGRAPPIRCVRDAIEGEAGQLRRRDTSRCEVRGPWLHWISGLGGSVGVVSGLWFQFWFLVS
jgi:hypothetical protein